MDSVRRAKRFAAAATRASTETMRLGVRFGVLQNEAEV
jgi:hypothetical protein